MPSSVTPTVIIPATVITQGTTMAMMQATRTVRMQASATMKTTAMEMVMSMLLREDLNQDDDDD